MCVVGGGNQRSGVARAGTQAAGQKWSGRASGIAGRATRGGPEHRGP